MKVAVTAQQKSPDSPIDPRFGRARCFIVFDTDSGAWEAADNEQNVNAPSGAGIQAAQNLVGLGVEAVVTGHVGPNAFKTLQAAGIKVYLCPDGSAAQALEKFKAGALNETQGADVAGHWA